MKRFLVIPAAAAMLLAAAGSAQATIVSQKSIAKVRLGQTTAGVKGELGKPDKITKGSDDFGKFTKYSYDDLAISVTFKSTGDGGLGVTSIVVKGKKERTSKDVGVGSTEAEVKAGVKNVKCETFQNFGAVRTCHVGKLEAGQTVTDFAIATKGSQKGRVTRVTLGIVID